MNFTDFRCLIDTNIFVYALNPIDRKKSATARKLLKMLAHNTNGIVSEQVILELFNVLVCKLNMERAEARKLVSKLTHYEVVFPDDQTFRTTIDLSVLAKLAVWDAHVVAAAIQARAKYLLSEHLQDGQDFHGVVVKNPFSSKNVSE